MKWIDELAAKARLPKEAVIVILVFAVVIITSMVLGG